MNATDPNVARLIDAAQGRFDANEETAEVIFNDLGRELQDIGNLAGALEAYEKAVAANPDFAPAVANTGIIHELQGNHAAAIEQLKRALELAPDLIPVHDHLAMNYKELELPVSELKHLEVLLKAGVGDADFMIYTGLKFMALGRIAEAVRTFARANEMMPGTGKGLSKLLFAQNFDDVLSDEEFEHFARLNGANAKPADFTPFDFSNVQRGDGPLRVGFVSADFRDHPVTIFLIGILRSLDPGKIAIHLYHNNDVEDDMTAALKEVAQVWRQIDELDSDAAARQIHDDGVHILVDLSGHTALMRHDVFVRKPAPVQVTWFGCACTTGIGEIDYFLSSDHCIPEADHEFFAETPWRMPGRHMCYTPPNADIRIEPPPILERGHVSFGCCVDMSRYSDATVACWCAILERLPDATLTLKSKLLGIDEVQDYLAGRFAVHGVGRERLRFDGPSKRDAFIKSYNAVDIMLDPFPGNGLTTTYECLWMGTPVLSLRGRRLISRAGPGVLTELGLDELVVDTVDDYVDRAVGLANDLPRLEWYSSSLRELLVSSSLCDEQSFARDLGDVFEAMWEARR
ncbi:MAG: tetratricopeptide repeat protein [Rhodospirillales bacterium]